MQGLIKKFEVKEIHESLWRDDIPQGWLVFNAYRPLMGTLRENGEPVTWTKYLEGPEGIHFAAVDPEDPRAEMWIAENLKNRAVLLRYTRTGGTSVHDGQLEYFK